ncbi:MAG TPA: MgtC/SapB family protein, partial [Anaerolineae bacterium]|nr:MgtC/SapB family protein [Anaerolineae bacterium]
MEFIDFEQIQILALVMLGMFLGAVIGFERESANKPAGLRTHILVAGSAALLVALGDVVIAHFYLDMGNRVIQSDPVRIIEAIITGISFLGAGTIIYHRSENVVEGLTTAASILIAAGVGMSVALLQFTLAIGVTVLALVTLR